MARGKNAQKATNRRARLHQARVAALRAEIDAENETNNEIAAEVEAVERLHERLREATEARASDTEPEVSALQAEADLLTRLLRQQAEAEKTVDHQWTRVLTQAVDRNGGGREGLEWFMHATGVPGFLTDEGRLSTSRTTRLQKIRGERESLPDEATVDRARRNVAAGYLELLRPQYRRAWRAAGLPEDPNMDLDRADLTAGQRSVYEDTMRAAKSLTESRATSLDVDSLRSWHPLPWLVSPTGAVHAADDSTTDDADEPTDKPPPDQSGQSVLVGQLGAVWLQGEGQRPEPTAQDAAEAASLAPPKDWPTATPALSAVTRRRVTTAGPERLAHEWRATLAAGEALVRILGPAHSVLRAGPRHPRPGRAASLRHLYTKAALGDWIRAQDNDTARTAADDTTQSPVGRSSRARGEVCVALTTAAPFWLPRSQTYTFANSEPLSPDDVGELLLPFPQVFLAFAEPIHVEPHRQPTKDETAALADLDQAAALLRNKNATLEDMISDVRDLDHFGSLTVAEALDVRGAHIEGVLVLADSLGRLEDTFAWCLRIPSGADSTLGRHVIPASLAATAHRTLVENLIAVAAWADWHAPDAETEIPSGRSTEDLVELMDTPQFRREADRSGGGGVRVLNVKATNRGGSANPDGLPTSQIAPHVRRGHWRRQRFGAGSQQIKRIRIAPVIVNAHRGTPETRVYTLPASRAAE